MNFNLKKKDLICIEKTLVLLELLCRYKLCVSVLNVA